MKHRLIIATLAIFILVVGVGAVVHWDWPPLRGVSQPSGTPTSPSPFGGGAGLGPSPAEAVPVITWTPPSLVLTLSPGETRIVTASFLALIGLPRASLSVAPELQPFLAVSPASLGAFRPGQTITITLTITAPLQTQPQTVDGTIQLHSAAGQAIDLLLTPLRVSLTIGASHAAITWTPATVTHTLLRGTAASLLLQLESDTDLSDVSLHATPELSGLISFPPTGASSMLAGTAYSVQLLIESGISVAPGVYSGSIYIKSGPLIVSQALPVSLQIIVPSDNIVPGTVSTPTPDRVITTPSGQRVVKDEVSVDLKPGTLDPDQRIMQIASSTGGAILGSLRETFDVSATV